MRLVYALPTSHREENNRPGASYQRDRQCLEFAKINIILSRLCNSRQMRQLHASNGVGLRGTEARSNVLQGVRLHNLDYVNLASVSELRAFCLRIPGRGGGRRAAPLKDLRPPGPSGGCALPGCFDSAASIRASRSSSRLRGQAHGDHCLRYFPRIKRRWYARTGSADTNTVIKIRRVSLAFSHSATRASCRLTHLPVLGRSLSVSQAVG